MADTSKLSAAELQALADAAAWREYLGAQKAKQLDRVTAIQARIDVGLKAIAGAKARVAEIDKQLVSGVIGKVPRPQPGGVTINVPTGLLKMEGK